MIIGKSVDASFRPVILDVGDIWSSTKQIMSATPDMKLPNSILLTKESL